MRIKLHKIKYIKYQKQETYKQVTFFFRCNIFLIIFSFFYFLNDNNQ